MIENGTNNLSFWQHVEVLRKTLIQVIVIILGGASLALFFYPQVMEWLTSPLAETHEPLDTYHVSYTRVLNSTNEPLSYTIPQNPAITLHQLHEATPLSENSYLLSSGGFLELAHVEPIKKPLIILSPIEGMTTVFKACFWIGMTATSPLWLFSILRFIAPALKRRERKLLFPFILLSILFLGFGFLFSFYLTIPLGNAYLNAFNERIGVNFWSLSHYLNYTWTLLFANMIAFEFFVVLLFLVHYRIIREKTMRDARRGVCVGIFILSALLTPPDILTLFMLALPLQGLYELGIFYAVLREKSIVHAHRRDRAYHVHPDNSATDLQAK